MRAALSGGFRAIAGFIFDSKVCARLQPRFLRIQRMSTYSHIFSLVSLDSAFTVHPFTVCLMLLRFLRPHAVMSARKLPGAAV